MVVNSNSGLSEPQPKEGGRPFGFNVVGYVTGNLGLGVAARNIVELVIQNGFSVSVHDLDPGGGRAGHDTRFDKLSVRTVEDLPYAVNLFVVPAPVLGLISRMDPSSPSQRDYLNVAVPFWELPRLPPQWIPELDAMDVVVAVSESMRCAFQLSLSGPLIVGGLLPLQLPREISGDRRRFTLPDDAVLFATSFETNSDPQRKNPCATIDAFLRGAGDVPHAYLVVRINNAETTAGEHPAVREILKRSNGHPRIRISTEPLSYPDVLSLYAACDAYVSLHRAEGLGLGLMEAMSLGKAVVATAWSGNTSFMNHVNSCLVSYELVPVNGSIDVYSRAFLGETAYWADPSIAEAAAWIRKLAQDTAFRVTIGQRAAQDMAQFQHEARRGLMLKEMEAIWRNQFFLPAREQNAPKPRQPQQLLAERDRRISNLESELRWITNKVSYKIAKSIKGALTKDRTKD